MDPEILEVLKEHPKLIAMFLPTLHVTVREGSVTISIDKQEQEDPGQTGTVNTQGSNLNVRTGPSTGCDIITQLMNGTDVKVLGEKRGRLVPDRDPGKIRLRLRRIPEGQ